MTNFKNRPNNHKNGVSATSSSNIIWDGPDISCLSLCKGDSVSEVIYKLGKLVCDMVENFNIENYALGELGENCKIVTFTDLLNHLIKKYNSDCCNSDESSTSNNSLINVESCLRLDVDKPESLSPNDYIVRIAANLCSFIKTFDKSESLNQDLYKTVNVLNESYDNLIKESVTIKNLDYKLNSEISSNGEPMFIVQALQKIETDYVTQKKSIGDKSNLNKALMTQKLIEDKSFGVTKDKFKNLENWNTNSDLAASVNNLWLVVNDLKESLVNIISSGANPCMMIKYNFRAKSFKEANYERVVLYLDGSTGLMGYSDYNLTSIYKITDAKGNSTTGNFKASAIINSPEGFAISLQGTSIDPSTDLKITVEINMHNESLNTTCQKQESFEIKNSDGCPAFDTDSDTDSISYSLKADYGKSYKIELYENTARVPKEVFDITTSGLQSGVFKNLKPSTTYRINILVFNGGGLISTCPDMLVVTKTDLCPGGENIITSLTLE